MHVHLHTPLCAFLHVHVHVHVHLRCACASTASRCRASATPRSFSCDSRRTCSASGGAGATGSSTQGLQPIAREGLHAWIEVAHYLDKFGAPRRVSGSRTCARVSVGYRVARTGAGRAVGVGQSMVRAAQASPRSWVLR